jgi:hypothetical protein
MRGVWCPLAVGFRTLMRSLDILIRFVHLPSFQMAYE